MINEKGERVAAPKPPVIPPHMLAGMTSAAQKKALRSWQRADATVEKRARRATKKAAGRSAPAKKAASRGATKRVAKQSAAAPAPSETKE